jgi:transcriptional regulator with XRE-family HTH domain
MSSLLRALGHEIRRIREEKRLSQEQLAELADLHRTYISSVERGRRNLSIQNLYKIAKALGVSMQDIVHFCEDKLDPLKMDCNRG